MAYKVPNWTTLDFETEKIQPRPYYPPRPVSVAIKKPGERKGRFYAWGHPTKNNCTKEEGFARVREVINEAEAILCQEAKFDIDVAVTHVPGCTMPDWRRIHDTKYMLFMRNPHASTLQLKPSAELYLGMPPEEQDLLKEWILKNVRGAKASDWGAYIALAPGDIVGPYAVGDVIRTDGLGKQLLPYLHKWGMLEAYDRERRLMPIMLRNEQEGIRTDVEKLEADTTRMKADVEVCDGWLRKRLRNKNLNVDSDAEFAEALSKVNIVADQHWVMTKTGKRSTSKKNLLPHMFKDQKVFQAFSHRNKLQTCISTFAEPWLEQARSTGGTIHTNWRQVKGTGAGGDAGGARSGRKQSTPNFQNIPKNFNKKDPNYSKPAHLEVADLPFMRRYLLPDSPSHIWGRRDYNQQELRILGHFENGVLMDKYQTDPRYDVHTLVQNGLLERLMREFERDAVKASNFQDIYGGGIPAACASLGCDEATARAVKKAKDALMPGVAALRKDLEETAKAGNPIRTWGGRIYYVEESKYVAKFGREMEFYYKLLNYLIQGSAADCTKEAIIRYDEHPKKRGRLIVDVHDEININAGKKVFKQEMAVLREVMQSVEFDVPMLSDGEFGPNWGSMQKFVEPEFNIKKWRKEKGLVAAA